MDDREQYLLNEIIKLRKENAEIREQIERYEKRRRILSKRIRLIRFTFRL